MYLYQYIVSQEILLRDDSNWRPAQHFLCPGVDLSLGYGKTTDVYLLISFYCQRKLHTNIKYNRHKYEHDLEHEISSEIC